VKGLQGKCRHLDPTSARAKRDYEQNANGYRTVREFLDPVLIDMDRTGFRLGGGRDWLGGFGPMHQIVGPDGLPLLEKHFVKFCKKGAHDRSGRSRDCVAYRGILSPPDSLQSALRDMCLRAPMSVAPKGSKSYFEEAFLWLKTRLQKEFPGVPLVIAFHTGTGRAHWEWIVPKYGPNGKVARPGVKWDCEFFSARHALAFMRTGKPAECSEPQLNSIIERDFSQHLILSYRQVMSRAGVRRHTLWEVLEAELFFLRLQEASLRDGMKSRRLLRARDAERELLWNLGRQQALRRRRVACARQIVCPAAPKKTPRMGRLPSHPDDAPLQHQGRRR
jgi:hypothetical protein